MGYNLGIIDYGCDDYGIFMNSIYIYIYVILYGIFYDIIMIMFRETLLSLLIHISPTLYVETSWDIVDCFIGIFLDIKLTESTQFWWNTQPVYFFACVCQMGKKKNRSEPALRSCHQKLAVEAGKMIVQPSVRIQQEWGVTHRIQGLNMRYFCRIYADSC